MNLNKIFAKAAVRLAGKRNIAELEDKCVFLNTHTFYDPVGAGTTAISAMASKNPDNTWNVATYMWRNRNLKSGESGSADELEDIANNLTLDEAIAALKKFEDDKFKAGFRVPSILYAIDPGHYSTYRSAIVKWKRQSGPKNT